MSFGKRTDLTWSTCPASWFFKKAPV